MPETDNMAEFIASSCVDEYLTAIRQGDRSALAPLYEETARPLYALCYTYMHNAYESEDALSETYLAALRGIGSYRGSSGFAWLYTIAKNVCRDLLRGNRRVTPVDFSDEETVNALPLASADAPRMPDESGIVALSERILSETDFRILVLHAVSGLKFKEIARIVGGIEATVRWRYNRAIQKIKNAYEGGKKA